MTTTPSAFTRFVRGLLLFSMGVIVGGTLVYLGLARQPSMQAGSTPAVASAPPRSVDPAAPPAQPVGSLPRTDVSPEAPAGQFDYIPSAQKPMDNTAVAAAAAPVLEGKQLLLPVQGIRPEQLTDTFTDARSGGRVHDAIDIMAPAGTPVLAAVDGTIAKLFDSKLGGITLYQYGTSGELVYYYAHLQGYAPGIAQGMAVKRGDLLGYVGSTGNANPAAPHLHFAVMAMDAERKWWKGTALNPYPLLTGRPGVERRVPSPPPASDAGAAPAAPALPTKTHASPTVKP